MRRLLSLVATCALFAPALVRAQEAPAAGAAPDDGGASEVDALDARAGETRLRDFGGAATPSAPDSHTVERGDTLWDISGKYMGSPWYWPKVWSYNPQIENPHWIYPGDQVRFSTEEAELIADPEELADVSRGGFGAPLPGSDEVTIAGKIGFAQPTAQLARHDGFVTERELAESGVIEKSWEEKELLGSGDRIYVSWPNREKLKLGDRYVIYRTDREIEHPVSGSSMGYLTRILGSAKVVEADAKRAIVTAIIERSFSEIERGDLIGPSVGQFGRRVPPKANQATLAGYVAATLEPGMAELGQWSVVFVDRGRNDGVEEGNTFDVLRAGDGLEDDGYTPHFDTSLPIERIGRLMIIDTKETASAALVVNSAREIRIGDRIRMRPPQPE